MVAFSAMCILLLSVRDFPGGSVFKTLGSQCRGHGFGPWSGNYPTCHVVQPKCVCVCVCVYKRLGSIQGQENAIVCFVIIPIFDFTENNLP